MGVPSVRRRAKATGGVWWWLLFATCLIVCGLVIAYTFSRLQYLAEQQSFHEDLVRRGKEAQEDADHKLADVKEKLTGAKKMYEEAESAPRRAVLLAKRAEEEREKADARYKEAESALTRNLETLGTVRLEQSKLRQQELDANDAKAKAAAVKQDAEQALEAANAAKKEAAEKEAAAKKVAANADNKLKEAERPEERASGADAKDELATKIKAQTKIGLAWIAKQQSRDGSWGRQFGAPDSHRIASTAFCGLALLASGNKAFQRQIDLAASYVGNSLFVNREAPVSPRLKAQIRQMKQKMQQQLRKQIEEVAKDDPELAKQIEKARGKQFDPNEEYSLDNSNWRVAIGGVFLCEYYACRVKNDPEARPNKKVLDRLVAECFKRMETSGGWGHGPRIKNVLGYLELEIVSNWMLTTVGGCQRLGCDVPEEQVNKAVRFIQDSCAEGTGAVGYSPRFGQKGAGCPCRTGGAIFAFGMLKKTNHPLYPLMVEYWKESYKDSVGAHGSVALGVLSSALGARQIGGEAWESFASACFPKVLAAANKDGTFQVLPEVPRIPAGATSFSAKVSFGTGPALSREGDQPFLVGLYTLSFLLDRGNLAFMGKRLE
jgi:hypothetical protein